MKKYGSPTKIQDVMKVTKNKDGEMEVKSVKKKKVKKDKDDEGKSL